MVDSAQMQWVLETARERGTTIIAMGGLSQLQPIGPGSGMRIVAQAAQEHCTYVQLHDIRRQRADWHREAVVDFEDALDAARLSRDEERQLFELVPRLRSISLTCALASARRTGSTRRGATRTVLFRRRSN